MTVADERGRRWDAATGIAFAVVAFVALVLPGIPPAANASSNQIRRFFVAGREQVLVGDLLLGVSLVLFIWFLGAARSYLRSGEGGEGRLSAAAFGGGVAGVTLVVAGAALFNGIAFDVAAGANADLVRAFYDAASAFFTLSAFGFATFFAAASCSGARSGALSPALYWSGSVAAVLQLPAGIALFARSGFFAVGGAYGFVAPIAALVWTVALSAAMMRRSGVPPRPRAEP
ncbi:MAG: hypothetical protein ACJ76S_13365 [Solirubrobacteraceae bacterium]|jgi:hypothetical protein